MAAPDELAACECTRPAPGCTVLTVTGELDACSTPRVEAEVLGHLASGTSKVILDLSSIGFIDSTGIRLVMIVINRKKLGEEVVIVSPSRSSPQRALELVGLGKYVRIVRSDMIRPTARENPSVIVGSCRNLGESGMGSVT